MSEEEQKHLQQSYYDLHEKYNKQKEEIERLTGLCNKYEEEHKTTFETWQKDIKEIERLKIQVSARETEYERLHSIIKEARDYIEKNAITNISWLGTKATKKELFKDNASLYELLQILDKVGEE